MQRLIHNSGIYGIGRPAIEEPWHEELHERRIGIEFEIIEAREFIPGLMHRQSSVGLNGQHEDSVKAELIEIGLENGFGAREVPDPAA
jgi:hypothetical protein